MHAFCDSSTRFSFLLLITLTTCITTDRVVPSAFRVSPLCFMATSSEKQGECFTFMVEFRKQRLQEGQTNKQTQIMTQQKLHFNGSTSSSHFSTCYTTSCQVPLLLSTGGMHLPSTHSCCHFNDPEPVRSSSIPTS